jgi:hypothetical protein
MDDDDLQCDDPECIAEDDDDDFVKCNKCNVAKHSVCARTSGVLCPTHSTCVQCGHRKARNPGFKKLLCTYCWRAEKCGWFLHGDAYEETIDHVCQNSKLTSRNTTLCEKCNGSYHARCFKAIEDSDLPMCPICMSIFDE